MPPQTRVTCCSRVKLSEAPPDQQGKRASALRSFQVLGGARALRPKPPTQNMRAGRFSRSVLQARDHRSRGRSFASEERFVSLLTIRSRWTREGAPFFGDGGRTPLFERV